MRTLESVYTNGFEMGVNFKLKYRKHILLYTQHIEVKVIRMHTICLSAVK
jgi:hypothetical protein